MNTVIVPVDFSETSLHAAKFAAEMLRGQYGVTMLLYNSYSKDAEGASSTSQLEALKASLMKEHIVKMEILSHQESDFVEGMEKVVRHRKADLVVMGIRNRSAVAQFFFGSNTLRVLSSKVCPVLIVPENADYMPIRNVMLASDFKDTFSSTPSAPIRDFLLRYLPKLFVVNVNKDHYISLEESFEKEKQQLKSMFSDFNPEFYFMRLFDVEEAINLFARDKDINLIIAVQRDKSLMERIFSRSRTESLSYQSKIPVLAIHE